MSLSDPSLDQGQGLKNPATKFFEWNGAMNGGFIYYYDKDAPHPTDPQKKGAKIQYPIKAFIVLDVLNTIKGFTQDKQFVWANEVRNTKTDVMEVSVGNQIRAKGLYQDIKALANGLGGDYLKSVYIAFKDLQTGQMVLGNIQMQGSLLGAFIQFCDENPLALKGKAIVISGKTQMKNGAVDFLAPAFTLMDIDQAILNKAIEIDSTILQPYLKEYLNNKPDMNVPIAQPVAQQFQQPVQQFQQPQHQQPVNMHVQQPVNQFGNPQTFVPPASISNQPVQQHNGFQNTANPAVVPAVEQPWNPNVNDPSGLPF